MNRIIQRDFWIIGDEDDNALGEKENFMQDENYGDKLNNDVD